MKKGTLIALAVVACALLSAGQAMSQLEFGVGPKLGLNFASTSISPTPVYPAGATQGGRTTFMIGAQAELGFAKMFYVQLEPGYIGKGYSVSGSGGSVTVSVSELQFPVLFKVKFMKGIIRPYAFLGPNIGFVMSATETFAITGQTIPDQDLKSNTSSTDFSLDFGGGAEYNVTPKIGITGDIRYSLGLANLNNNPLSPGVTIKGSGFQILFGAMSHIM